MGRQDYITREQFIGSAVAIYDWATTGEQRHDIDWSRYDSIPLSQIVAPLLDMGSSNDRVYNLHRDLRRKANYTDMLDVIAPLDYYQTEGFYRKSWWQIRMNHLVADTRARFGVDIDTFATMISFPPHKVVDFEDFHEQTNKLDFIYAFEQTAAIPPPKTDEFRRKFKRARREYRERMGEDASKGTSETD
jgi:hypothetical protein